jgi:hypothetical protein
MMMQSGMVKQGGVNAANYEKFTSEGRAAMYQQLYKLFVFCRIYQKYFLRYLYFFYLLYKSFGK